MDETSFPVPRSGVISREKPGATGRGRLITPCRARAMYDANNGVG